MKKLLMIFIMLGVSTCSIYAQNKTIKGKIIDDKLNALPYVTILFNDSIEVGRTDLNGFFQISIPAAGKKYRSIPLE
ncbi:hypothetical protein [Arcticibacter sp. MXS-1]|uniref:hypothetical protein n=1 Tax=Arcticibacter sp. MXS-1 TaxID=3341726 RepID=UPI0035A97859